MLADEIKTPSVLKLVVLVEQKEIFFFSASEMKEIISKQSSCNQVSRVLKKIKQNIIDIKHYIILFFF
jgi:hypothetical protein